MRARKAKIVLVNLVTILLVLAIFDIVMYRFLAERYTTGFSDYRKAPSPSVPGRSEYPANYFVEHADRGFDIGENKQGYHWVEGIEYPIWSNSLGCFDVEYPREKRAVYFAGDSFTWGYAPFENKFGTLVEQLTGADILKCGVTHTGQRHQLAKFGEIVDRLATLPRAVFVFYSANDIANDYAHPHTTVMQGWQIDSVSLTADNHPVRFTQMELEKKIQEGLARLEQRRSLWWQSAAQPLLRYSLSASIFNALGEAIGDAVENALRQHESQALPGANTPSTPTQKQVSAPSISQATADVAQPLRGTKSIYHTPSRKGDRYWYQDNPYAIQNKQALIDFQSFTASRGIQYIVVLIPPKNKHSRLEWYAELRRFLTANGIEYLDLAEAFNARKLKWEDIYWPHDGHFNFNGNREVATIISEHYGHIFVGGDADE